ncbi:MAG: hypothetical protein HY741_11895 [Chloroflexi bacterium]|nr:hypothetical protein [Chloroflexota bacterium]
MSTSVFQPAHELSCPNCGAPCTLSAFGNQVECEYCGTRFLVPATHRPTAPVQVIEMPDPQVISLQAQTNVARWVKWIVIIVVVSTVLPVVCSIVFGVCGAFAGLAPIFLR